MNEPRRRRRRFEPAPTVGEHPAATAPVASLATVAAEPPRAAPAAPTVPPPLKTMTDLERAEKRAQEILDHGGDFMEDGQDAFYFPLDAVPDGWTYEWKKNTVHNEPDPKYQVQLANNGWEPVPASRHPEMMPTTGGPYHIIERDGLILMQRPASITKAIRDRDSKRARMQVKAKEDQLRQAPSGTFERNAPVLRKQFEKIVLPQD